jgi:DNA (cytosine-5)-methyltransferase 1
VISQRLADALDAQTDLLDLDPDELIIDSFAGGGGASSGIELATGRQVDYAFNHDKQALLVHLINHPKTIHLLSDIWEINPAELLAGRRVGLFWASPDCTHFSRAKGAKPKDKGIRGLANVIADRWAALPAPMKPRVIIVENVEEFMTWGPLDGDGNPMPLYKGAFFKKWWRKMEGHGYRLSKRVLYAHHYGAPTRRKRLFILAVSDGRDPETLWPEATHGPGLIPFRVAADIIDWSIPCPSIFERKKPLAEATQRRIARGFDRFVVNNPKPYIVPVKSWGGGGNGPASIDDPLRAVTTSKRGEHALVRPIIMPYNGDRRDGETSRAQDVDAPLSTQPAANRFALTLPTLIQTGYGERPGQTPRALDLHEPIGTLVDGQKHGLVSFLAKHFGGNEATGTPLDRVVDTVTARDHHSLVTANLVHLKGTSQDGLPVTEPVPSLQAQGQHVAEVRAFLIKYYGEGSQGQAVDEPLHTVTALARFGLVTILGVLWQVVDIGMRMLSPRELFRAQGFYDEYIIDPVDPDTGKPLTKEAQIRLCGNSVCPPLACAIVRSALRRRPAIEQQEMQA